MKLDDRPELDEYRLEETTKEFVVFPEIVTLIRYLSKPAPGMSWKRTAHYASDASTCLRGQAYKWMGIPATNPVNEIVRGKGMSGRLYEEYIKELIRRAGLFGAEEYRIGTSDPPASFRVDVLFSADALRYLYEKNKMTLLLAQSLPEEGGQYIPVELKSISEFPFDGGKYFKGAVEEPKWNHYCQLQLYLYVLDAPFGFFIYINRDDTRMASHLIWRDQPLIDKMIYRQRALEWYLEHDELPEGEGYISLGSRGGVTPDQTCKLCGHLFYCKWKPIMEQGTKKWKNKVRVAFEMIGEEHWTDEQRGTFEE